MTITYHSVPALIALAFKLVLLVYAIKSPTRNGSTRIYFYLLLLLSLQNVAEFACLIYLAAYGIDATTTAYAYAYVAFLIPVAAVILHLSLRLNWNKTETSGMHWFLIYLPVVPLELLLLFSPNLIPAFVPFQNSVLRIPGPWFFLLEGFVATYWVAAFVNLIAGVKKAHASPISQARNRLWILGLSPMLLLLIYLVVANHFSWTQLTWTFYIPMAMTFFLVVTTYATHQYRLFDIQFYVPWSKVRKRKTAFYDRIQSTIAEIADLGSGSVSRALDRLADTLRCPVAFVDDSKSIIAAVGAPQMLAVPLDTLKGVDHILVANEIADAKPEAYAAMKQHGIAAIVPFHPHSHNAASWLLLGEAFSDQVYTTRDFRMVEQLFDKMADLFLDKLVEMRTKLADAHLQIQTLKFQLELAHASTATLEQRVETLARDNLRLVQEQPADSLLLGQRPTIKRLAITLLGWNKALRERLRVRLPQLEQFAGPDSLSFRRRPMPDVLLCEVENDTRSEQRKLADLIAHHCQRCAVLLIGSGAAEFAAEYRKQLLGRTVEVLPNGLSDEAIERRVAALVRLRESLIAVPYPNFPLLANSVAYSEAMAEAHRLAGFADPVCVLTADADEAAAVGAFMHEASRREGSFRVLRAAKLLAREARATGEEAVNEIDTLLTKTGNGTLMIDDLGALPNELWDQLLLKTNEFAGIRLIAACSPGAAQTPTTLFKPLRPQILELPTLRERREDIPMLAHYYTLQYNLQTGTWTYLTQTDIDDIMSARYPVDLAAVRTAVFDRLRTKSKTSEEPAAEPSAVAIPDVPQKTLDECVAEIEKRLIEQALKRCGGNKSKAARILGIRPNTLHYKLERYGLLNSKS